MNDDIKDVEFEEIKNEDKKNIRGKILYYSTSQVATLLEQPDSKIRYYTSVFDEILQIKISNKQRQYTQQDIDKLRFIIELKNEGMTIRQIQEYCSEVDFNSENGIQIKESNPLSIQSLATALLEEQNKQLSQFKEKLLDEIVNKLNDQTEHIKVINEQTREDILEQTSIAVDELVTEKLKSSLSDFKIYLDMKEQETTKRLNEQEDLIKYHMEERKKLQEQLEQEKKKGFWNKWFKR